MSGFRKKSSQSNSHFALTATGTSQSLKSLSKDAALTWIFRSTAQSVVRSSAANTISTCVTRTFNLPHNPHVLGFQKNTRMGAPSYNGTLELGGQTKPFQELTLDREHDTPPSCEPPAVWILGFYHRETQWFFGSRNSTT